MLFRSDFSKCPSLMPALTAIKNDAVAAWDAVRAAAWDAALAAVRAAARDAAWAKFAETVRTLQASAIELVERMATLRDEQEVAA